MAGDILQKVAIVHVVAHQWRESDRVLVLFPKFEIIVCKNSQLLGKALDCINDFFDENLQH